MNCEKADQLECLNIKSIKPKTHQKQVCKFLLQENHRGLLVFHSVGSGKTITSLLSAKCLLSNFPNKNVIILTGKSLFQVFKKEMEKLNMDTDKRISISSYGTFINRLKTGVSKLCKNNILIIDEIHNFVSDKSLRAEYLIKCAKQAFKVILLTATPVTNRPKEIANSLAMLIGVNAGTIKPTLKEALKDQKSKIFKDLFECKVSFFENKKYTKNYPKKIYHEIKFKMSPQYYAKYYKIQEDEKEYLPGVFANGKNLTIFLNGIRRAVNKIDIISPKITWIFKKIKDDLSNNKKIIIYSAWKEHGIDIIKNFMDENNIKYSEVSGDISKVQRKNMVEKYNNGETKIMIITNAGSEGLDLKGTRSIILLSPSWNGAKTTQIIGRGVRYRSHSHLPPSERTVDIYNLILTKPDKKYEGDNMESSDVILKKLSEQKSEEILDFYKNIIPLSIENDKKCFSNKNYNTELLELLNEDSEDNEIFHGPCLQGKVINPKTGRCIKEKVKKICLPGKVINPKTGRCIKEKVKKICPPGKVINPKTGRCIKR